MGGGTIVQSDGDPATQAKLVSPMGLILDTKGDLVFADGNAIRTVSQDVINTLPVTLGSLSFPQTLAYDVAGNLFITEFGGPLVEFSTGGTISSVALPVVVQRALSVATDPLGNLYVGDDVNHAIWKLTPQYFCGYTVTTPGVQPGAGGPLNLTVTSGVGCNWAASSNNSWITVSSGSSGSGNGTVQLAIAPNTTPPVRTGSVIIAGQVLAVTQNWTPVPSAVSVTPYSGSGATQTFTLEYSDTTGAASLNQVYAWFNTQDAANNSCELYYNAASNQINLLNDAATAWLTATLGAATTLQNSQCSLNVETQQR